MSLFCDQHEVPVGSWRKTSLSAGSDPLDEVTIPLWIVRGREDGPMVCVVAGVHGCEYPSILAAVELYDTLQNNLLRGTVAIVPVANTPAFQRVSRYVCPIDGVNLNRAFPGDSEGSISQRIAFEIFEKVVKYSDHLLDLHGGDQFEQLLPHTKYLAQGDSETVATSRMLAMEFTESRFQPFDPGPAGIGGALFVQAVQHGVPSIIAEAGGEAKIDSDALRYHSSGIWRVLHRLGLVEARHSDEGKRCEEGFNEVKMRCACGGFFISLVAVGDRVNKDQVIGKIKNLDNEVIEQLSAPYDGEVLMLFTIGVVATGDRVISLWQTRATDTARS